MLQHKADIRSLLFLLVLLALKVGFWWLGDWWFGVLPIVLIGFCAVTIFHNHAHQGIFKNESANHVLNYFLLLLTGSTPTSIKVIHLMDHHHKADQEDDWGHTGRMPFRWEGLNLLLYPMVTIPSFVRNKFRFMKQEKYRHLKRQQLKESAVFFGFHLILFVIQPIPTLVFLLLTNLMIQWLLVSMNYLQHYDCDPDSSYNNSRNFTGKLLNFFVFNNGFHTIHHLYPGMHWTKLPKQHQEKVVPHIDPDLNKKSLLWTAVQLMMTFKKRSSLQHI